MTNERFDAIVEELAEVASTRELMALLQFAKTDEGAEYRDDALLPHFEAAVARLSGQVEDVVETAPTAVVAKQPPVKRAATRGGRQYRLLSDDVSWATAPQIHGVMEILKAHVPVGGTISDEDAVAAMVANEETVLKTRQGGEKIWRYYLGKHERGLMAHNNLEIVA